ncbi:MAG: type II toxin-antitoxin system VapC family toxin [Desulfurellaceae bacterium]|nr:type II toxin-antitoxin system VapC family toxin [Desulfurellaceae bacterium]
MIVLDTCAIIWDALNADRLTTKAKQTMRAAEADRELMISDISIWEIAMLVARKRLEIEETVSSFINLYLQYRTITVQPISSEIAELSVSFGREINSDPADRIIAATTILTGAKLVTADDNLIHSAIIPTVW